jgi:hypothetical protein
MGYDRTVASGGRPGGDRRPEGDLGVVEPLRPPDGVVRAWRGSVAWFAAQPLLARLFVGLASIDIVVRGLGVVGPPIFLDLTSPGGILASFLPHDLLILLPALIVIRRPNVTNETPNVVDGAILVALVELLAQPSTALASTMFGLGPWAVVAIAATTVQVVGWIIIGRGLATLNGQASPTTTGWANLAAFGILAGVLVTLATFRFDVDFGDAEVNGLMALNGIVTILAPVALAYVGRVVIRGFDDEGRPEIALRVGAAAVFLAAGLGLVLNIVTFLAINDVGFGQAIARVPGWGFLYWLGTGGAISLLVVAFGLGLADATPQGDREGVTLAPR